MERDMYITPVYMMCVYIHIYIYTWTPAQLNLSKAT